MNKIILIACTIVLIIGCKSQSPANVRSLVNSAQLSNSFHTVKKKETLYAIAWKEGLDYKKVALLNNISPPYVIYEGQRLTLRKYGSTSIVNTSKTIAKTVSTKTVPKSIKTTLKSASTSVKKRTKLVTSSSKKTLPKWQWPVKGRITRTANGLDISGSLGKLVYAASNGEVVYSGNGLRNYGNLIIIKHSKNFLSAYAHNRKNMVKEKEKVKKGQLIAEMGRSGSETVKLHFEIRHKGKPIDPRKVLP